MNEPVEVIRAGLPPTPDGSSLDELFPGAPAGPAPGATAPRTRRRRRHWLTAIVLVLLLLVAAAGWLVFRGVQAVGALRDAEKVIGEMQTGLSDTATAAIVSRLPALEKDAATARRATSDPIWRAAAHLPAIGPNFAAVATVSTALDDVAGVALPAVEEVAAIADLKGLRGPDGRINLAPLADAAPALARAASAVAAASAAVAEIDSGALLSQLAGPVEKVQGRLAGVSTLLAGGARFAALLPPMLGADGPRTYLLLSLNSAELRSAGGIVGAVAQLRADGGAIELVDQRTTVDFRGLKTPVLPLSADEIQVHTDRLGRFLQNTVMTPDFPRTAALVTQFWRNAGGGEVDGVIATDPVAVSYLLKAIGPVTGPGARTLDARNVLAELLHDSYLRLLDPLDADKFFTGVAAAIFDAVSSGHGDAAKLIKELGRAGVEHRVRVWSAHPQEQTSIAETSVGGAFLSGGDDGAAGLFIDDGTGGKVDYFLHTAVSVEKVRCEAASTTAIVRLDLAYNPPADITTYPRYVTGYSGTDLPKGWVSTNLTVYAPVGGTLGPIQVADGVTGGLLATEAGRQVQVLTSRLQPGGTATYRFEIRTGRAGAGLPVWLTPTLTSPGFVAAGCS